MKTDFHQQELDLARRLDVNEACIEGLRPNDLYRTMMEKAFLSGSNSADVKLLRRLIKAWQYDGVLRGTKAFEALFEEVDVELVVFAMDEDQSRKFIQWQEKQPKTYCGAIGGNLTVSFTPTSIGMIIVAEQGKAKVDLSDYDNW